MLLYILSLFHSLTLQSGLREDEKSSKIKQVESRGESMPTQFNVTPKPVLFYFIMLIFTFANNTMLEGADNISDDNQDAKHVAIRIMVLS